MGAVIGSSSVPTQCQAGRHVKVNYTLLTYDAREVRKKLQLIRLVMKGLSSSLNLVIFLSKGVETTVEPPHCSDSKQRV